MTPGSTAPQPAYDNPLMPNAKLRQMYSAMLRARMLGDKLRSRNGIATLRGLEAALVSPAIELGPDDLVSDVLQNGALEFLRGTPAEQVLRPKARKSPATLANCGAATRLTAPLAAPERLWAAIGAAAALKARSAAAHASDGAVLVCYLRAERLEAGVCAKALAYISAEKLPLLLVLLPAPRRPSAPAGRLCALALRHRIPGMAVDQDDAVALYRVAQEAIGHARIGGGGAVIECVRYIVHVQTPAASDAIGGLAEYMLERGAADTRWLDAQAKSFARQIAR